MVYSVLGASIPVHGWYTVCSVEGSSSAEDVGTLPSIAADSEVEVLALIEGHDDAATMPQTHLIDIHTRVRLHRGVKVWTVDYY